MLQLIIIFLILIILELTYFRIADIYNIIDKPNERSSHSTIVLRGGGIIFPIAIIVWTAGAVWASVQSGQTAYLHQITDFQQYLPFIIGLILVAGVSFIDDIRSLPDSLRLIVQFASYGLMFWSLGVFDMFAEYGWLIGLGAFLLALIVCVGATNIYNFMDGINGITAGYSAAVLLPLLLVNTGAMVSVQNEPVVFVPASMILTVILAVVVFSIFNFRPKGKAKCFAGDVGSIGIAFILLFMIGRLIMKTGDVTYLIFLLVYGVDGCLTICHRIMLHENLGEAHRKHVYQLMANELKLGHVTVSLIYMALQFIVSLGFIYLCPNNKVAHWLYLLGALLLLSVAYVLFKKKYYHLHEEYLASLTK